MMKHGYMSKIQRGGPQNEKGHDEQNQNNVDFLSGDKGVVHKEFLPQAQTVNAV